MRPTEILMDEHRVIEQVLNCLERMADRCKSEGSLEASFARDAIDFFRNFADRLHHAKEEAQLFPMMEARGFSAHAGPTAVMRSEHEQGRELLGRMERAIEGAAMARPDDVELFVNSARSYTHLLREHIQKEDHCLFPMADRALAADDQQELLLQFDQAERDHEAPQAQHEYRRMADRLARKFEVKPVSA